MKNTVNYYQLYNIPELKYKFSVFKYLYLIFFTELLILMNLYCICNLFHSALNRNTHQCPLYCMVILEQFRHILIAETNKKEGNLI